MGRRVLSRRLTIARSPLDSDNRQPTTDNRQPTTDNRQPTTDNRQPTTDNRQPATDNCLKPGALRVELDAKDFEIGGDVKRGAVIAPGAVSGRDAGVDGSEQRSVGRKDVDPAGTGGENVAVF